MQELLFKINPLIFRAYDIRGIAGADLTEDTARMIGRGAGTFLQKRVGKRIAVGRDNRLSSPELTRGLMQGLREVGCDVTDIGLSPTPLLYYATCAFPFDGGINVTASHNPKQYNGFKIVGKGAHSVCSEELQEILKIITEKKYNAVQKPGDLETQKIFPSYISELREKIVLKRRLRIGIDAGNGIAGTFAPELFRVLGAEVHELYCELDGTFPNHEPNPEDEKNTRDLAELVRREKLDFGLAFDGDSDRLGMVDEKGNHLHADFLIILLARDILSRHKNGKIVFDVKVSQTVIEEIIKAGGLPVMCRTGHSFIENRMRDLHAIFGGEISGHFFIAENYYGFDDAFMAAARILEIASQSEKPFSHFFTNIPKTFTTPEIKASCPDDKKFDVIASIQKFFTKSKYETITIDGARVNFDATSWGAIRASNTAPYVTIRFEARTEKRLKEIQKEMAEHLQKYPEIDLSWYKK